MSLHWLQPIAWWALASLLVPILIHLLARDRSRRIRFPSLKFLPGAQMAALRRREITEWPLLVVRMLVLASAVAAAAAPVITSAARRAAWDGRVARAVVVVSPEDASAAQLARDEASQAFTAAEFRAPVASDAIRDAVDWLTVQPPAGREIAIIGDLRHGSIADADISAIPAHVGLRFLPIVTDRPADVRWKAVAEMEDGALALHTIDVAPDATGTSARFTSLPTPAPPSVRVVAPPDDQAHADAILRAVWREGVSLGRDSEPPDRRVIVEFRGAHSGAAEAGAPLTASWMRRAVETVPEARATEVSGALVVRMDLEVTDPRAVGETAAVVRNAFADARVATEPRHIAPATLAGWSRPAGSSPPDARPGDEGDRRWFWGAALLLLGVEHVLRGRRHVA